jgi:hypothetical protein
MRMIKSRRMRWAGHGTLMGEEKLSYKVLMGEPEGKRPLGTLDLSGRIILKFIL